MKRFLPIFVLTLAGAVPFLQGCILSNCDQGQKNCIQLEPATRFEGAPVSKTSAYSMGQGLKIRSINGSVNVAPGSSGNIEVTFQPFALDKKTNQAGAESQMTNNLVVDISTVGNDVVITTSRKSGSSSGLGADITVKVPPGFKGVFEVDQGNGPVTADLTNLAPTATILKNTGAGELIARGAGGALTIDTDLGDVTVQVAKWGAAGEDGTVHTGNGNIAFTAPLSANGQLVLTADGKITEGSLPTNWVKNETATSKAYTIGSGVGAHVDVKNDFGDIALTVE